QSRVCELIGNQKGEQVWVSTFHRFANQKILKPYWEHPFFSEVLGAPRGKIKIQGSKFKLSHYVAQSSKQYLSSEQLKHLKEILESEKLIPSFNSWVGLVRSYGFTPRTYFEQFPCQFATVEDLNLFDDRISGDKKAILFLYFIKIWIGYDAIIREHGEIDNDQLLVFATLFLEHNQAERKALRKRYPILLVDEFQDVNVCQYRLTLAMAGKGSNFSGFGDIKQAIYNFRGSSCALMAKLKELLTNTTVINLPDNFRSTEEIVAVANALSLTMPESFSSEPMIAHKKGKERPALMSFRDSESQFSWITDKILSIKGQGVKPCDIGIIYRNKHHAAKLENEFIERNVKFCYLSSENSLYEEPDVVKIMTYLHLICVPHSPFLLQALFSLFPSLKWHRDALLDRIKAGGSFISEKGINAHMFLSSLSPDNCPDELLGRITEIIRLILSCSERIAEVNTKKDPAMLKSEFVEKQKDVVSGIMRSYIHAFYAIAYRSKQTKNEADRFQALTQHYFDQIFSGLRTTESSLVEYIASRPILLGKRDRNEEPDPEAVQLMTIHASKG
ncbi:ATP-dependent helicase, partial [Vibrio anguillarum]|nr:ATP-dependent helicase [Vibrio anguillarum]